jgi:hypothetical protein
MEPWLLNWTAFLVRNTHATVEGLTYEEDGPAWFNAMWDVWCKNSDFGEELMKDKEK